MKPTEHIIAVAALAITAALPPSTAFAQISLTQEEGDRARELLLQGTAAIDAGNFEKAHALLKDAFELMQSYDIAAALGQTELALGQYPEAAMHLTFALRQYPPSLSRRLKTTIAEGLSQAKQHVAELRLTVTPADAEVFINEAGQGAASDLPPELFVAPGKQKIAAQTAQGRAVRDVVAVAGQVQTISLSVGTDPSANEADDPSSADSASNDSWQAPPSTTDRPSERSWAPIIAGGAVTALAAGTGIYFSIAASDDREKMRELRDANGEFGCSGESSQSADCEAQADAVRGADRNANLAAVSYTVAGVALVATAGYWLWARPDRGAGATGAGTGTTRVDGAIAPDRAILTFSGRF